MSNPPPRTAHLSTATSWRGGEQQALYLLEGLQQRGLKPLCIAQPGSPMAARAREASIAVAEIHCRAEYDPLAMWQISRAVKAHGGTLLHAHDAHAVTLAAFGGRLAGVPRLCTRRVDFRLKSAWKYRWGMDRVIAISNAIAQVCQNAGVPAGTIRTVRSGIDLARIETANTMREALLDEILGETRKKPLLVLNVASLTDHKGQRYLLDAMPTVMARLPQVHLLIAGKGELERELRKQANELAIEDQVHFLGFREDIPALLKSCDLFVMSSHLEGLCTSVMDAMAAGLAPVITDAGGLPELVRDNETGRIVPAKDPQALAAGLLDLLEDRKKRARMSRHAAEVARKEFGRNPMVEGTLAVYRELLAPGGDA